MSEIDVQRLKDDPVYWDEVAPEGATHAAFGDSNVPGWYRKEAGCWRFFPAFVGPKAWTKDCSQTPERDRPGFTSRPTEWRGPDDGLPPVGVKCEAYVRAETINQRAPGNKWLPGVSVGEAVAPNGGVGGLLKAEDGKVHFIGACTHFRPLKSDKERAVDEAMRASGHEKVGGFWTGSLDVYHAFGKAYDAGLLRLPEERS